jgi:hypothetical protein
MPISRGHEERRRTREPSRIGWSSSRLPIDPQVLAPVASVIEPRLHPECYRDTPKMALRALLDLAIEIPAILLRSMPHALAHNDRTVARFARVQRFPERDSGKPRGVVGKNPEQICFPHAASRSDVTRGYAQRRRRTPVSDRTAGSAHGRQRRGHPASHRTEVAAGARMIGRHHDQDQADGLTHIRSAVVRDRPHHSSLGTKSALVGTWPPLAQTVC